MALRDQPYIPLYVQDYLTDEKLNSCSASTQGVYIKIMCILHKQEFYGKILLKQKDKQKSSMVENFALKFAKLLPFDNETILRALVECVEEGVLIITGDEIAQKRMVKDGAVSLARSEAAKSGGGNPNLHKHKPKNLFKQKPKQNTEYDTEDETVIENKKKGEKDFELIYPFKSDSFNTAWDVFIRFRDEIKKPLKKLSQQAQLKKLSEYPESVAIKMIEQSIANGWQGIFELKENNTNLTPNGKRTQSITAEDIERIAAKNRVKYPDNGSHVSGTF